MFRSLGMILNAPARIKGARIGRASILGPGYDWLSVSWKNVVIGDRVVVGRRAWIATIGETNGGIAIGSETSIGRDCVISCASRIRIGEGCLFSYRVSILDHDHEFDFGRSPVGSRIGESRPISIGARTFIGCNSTILKGVALGEDVIVAANSVVTKSFDSGSVIAGVPATLIALRN